MRQQLLFLVGVVTKKIASSSPSAIGAYSELGTSVLAPELRLSSQNVCSWTWHTVSRPRPANATRKHVSMRSIGNSL